MAGRTVFVGGASATAAVPAEVAVAEPIELVAVTAQEREAPTSAETQVYELDVAPLMLEPPRLH